MNLNDHDLLKIAKCQTRFEAIGIVKQKVEHTFKSLMDIWRNEILFDLILDAVNFCLSKGFTFSECIECATFVYDSIEQIKKNSTVNPKSEAATSLVNSIDLFAHSLSRLDKLISAHKLKLFMDYINITLLHHFHLYKYVFTFERENQMIHDEKSVACPPKENFHDARLVDSKVYSLYEFEQKLDDFERQERLIREKYAIERDRLVRQEEMAKNLIKFVQSDANGFKQPLNDQTIKKMIDEVSEPILEASKKTIRCEVEEIKQRALINMEKSKLVKPPPLEFNLPKQSKNSLNSKKSK